MLSQQQSEAVRLLKWIRENRRDWDTICGRGDPADITDDDMLRLLKEMVEKSFYQIAFVLLNACEVRPKSNDAVFTAIIDTVLANEDGTGIEQFFQKVIQNFQ